MDVNEVNLSLSYGGVWPDQPERKAHYTKSVEPFGDCWKQSIPILAKHQNWNNNQNSFNSHLKRTIPIGLIIKKDTFSVRNLIKLTFASTFRIMPKLCAPSTFAPKPAFFIAHVAKYATTKLLVDADFQEWRQFKVKADEKKTTSVCGFFFFFFLFSFLFSGWCCHGVTTQVFYSETLRTSTICSKCKYGFDMH